MAVYGETMAQIWELGIPEAPRERVRLAIAGGFVADPPHRLIERVAPVIDPRQLFDLLETLDPLTDYGVQPQEEAVDMRQLARQVRTGLVDLERDLETLRAMRDRHPAPWSLADHLRDAVAEAERYVGWERDRLARFDARAEAADRLLKEAEQAGPHGPAARRRRALAPLAADLVRYHDWTYQDVAALVVSDGVWLDHPCPVTRSYWVGSDEGRSLADQLRQDVRRLARDRSRPRMAATT